MANWSDPRTGAYVGAGVGADARDAGLRAYMLSVYNYMASAVLLTGFIALAVSQTGLVQAFVQTVQTQNGPALGLTGLGLIVALAPLAFGLPLSFSRGGWSLTTLQVLFWGYAISLGLSFSTLFLTYTSTSIAQAFFGAAAGFAGLSLWGYTTKRDLSGFGTFLIMGVWGLIVAMLLNAFVFHSAGMELVVSAVGVLIFAGLAAFYTQQTKSLYFSVAGTEMQGKVAVLGAFRLYLAFVNLFLFLLRLFGNQRN